jgi:hypothetical protein
MAQLNAYYVHRGKRVDILTVVGTTFNVANNLNLMECGNFANTSGSALTLTLPAALPGRYHEVHCTSAHNVTLTPQSTEKISNSAGVVQAADALVRTATAGASIRLLCINTGEWNCVGAVGVWAVV